MTLKNSETSASKISWSNESSIKALLQRAFDLFTPPERLKPSEWTLKHRRHSPESSSKKGGNFTFDEAPWQPEVMDATTDPTVSGVVAMFASQTSGKTETVNNIVGHSIDIDPCPILLLQPTLEMAEAWSKDRLAPMLRDTPRLRGKVKDPRSRDAGNTILHKKFPGGQITIAGANSPASLASRPIRKVLFDEVDRYGPSAGTEGDPITLAKKRTETFPDAITIEISTPTIKNFSRIETSFELSDKNYWHVPCPQCTHWQHLKWCQVDFRTRGTEENPVYICENKECQHPLTNDQLQTAIRTGKWIATAPFKGIRGYHLSGLYCLFKPHKRFRTRLQQAVAGFLEAHRIGPEGLKAWTNTFLAETWEEASDAVKHDSLYNRRERYGGEDQNNPILPSPVIVLTASVDVQKDRAEIETLGWGLDDECWGIERKVIFGDPEEPKLWKELDDHLSKSYTHACGAILKIPCVCIDSGYAKSQIAVYRFVKARQHRRIFAVKGSSVSNAPLIASVKQSKKIRVMLYTIGTDTAKTTIYSRLQINPKEDSKEPNPRFMHFPEGFGYDEGYFKQLTAEKVITTYSKGFPKRTWKKANNDSNEALDLRVYNLAAREILNPNMKKLAADLRAKHPPKEPKEYILKESGSGGTPQNQETKSEASKPPTPPQPAKKKPRRRIQMGGTSFVHGWKKPF